MLFIMILEYLRCEIDDDFRGFSFSKDGPLDMRMGLGKMSAYDVVNNKSAQELSEIFFKFGNERFSRLIAKNIIISRKKNHLKLRKN